jgi:ankyrin repeat protein
MQAFACTFARQNDAIALKQLIDDGLDVNTYNRSGWAPLHAAATEGSQDCMKLLLQNGANPNIIGHWGRTPLHLACSWGRLECVSILLNAKADVSVKDIQYSTPLHSASWNCHPSCVRLLVAAGADVNSLCKGRGFLGKARTPLEMTTETGPETIPSTLNAYRECAEILLDAGAKAVNFEIPPWMASLLKKRANVKTLFSTLYGILRFRYTPGTPQTRICKDVVQLVCLAVWETRFRVEWEPKEEKI